MTRVLFDENLSASFAEGLDRMQYPLANGIEVTSIAKEFGTGVADGYRYGAGRKVCLSPRI